VGQAFHPPPRIAAIQGAANAVVQDAMRRFALRWAARGVTIAGLIEGSTEKRRGWLENIRSGRRYPLFQDLGPMATACHLDGDGLVRACADIAEEIDRGCDLVALSKFGQLEALRSGLTDAFALAVARDIPILTAVSPTYQAAWEAFSAPLGIIVPPEDAALDRWWLAVARTMEPARPASR
jgi:hypothetical protein